MAFAVLKPVAAVVVVVVVDAAAAARTRCVFRFGFAGSLNDCLLI
jgi:hypothetical protein